MNYDISLQTIAWINGRRNDGSLEISPKFQRRPVWLETERSALIGTIFSRLPFPEIYIQHKTDASNGQEHHIVVDGQQRITSILMFIDGEIPLPDDDDWQGQYFRDFDDDDDRKEAFWNYKVVVRGLSQTNDAEIRDLFTRLNTNNIALNDQELRNARYKGRFKIASERLADDALFQKLGLFTARDVRRMIDVEFASELLLLVVEGITNKKDMLESTYAAYEAEFPREAEFEEQSDAAISLLHSLVRPENKTPIKTKSNFYSLFGACLQYYRDNGRTTFVNTDAVAASVTDLLLAARSGEVAGKPGFFEEYHDAVTRASSDKGRRTRRQEILSRIINEADGR